MDKQIEIFINKFLKELEEENAAIFAGAGLSVGAGFVNWRELLRPIAEQLHLDVDKEHDLVSVAQYHCNHHCGNRHELNQLLIDEFCRDHTLTENHRILARLPIRTFWTTNYDRLIEKALQEAGRVPDVKYTVSQLAHTRAKRDSIVYKMHGDVEHPHDAILTKDDYERYHLTREPFITALSGDLVSKTFLFLGFSFTDPNLDYILSRIRINFPRDGRKHYCIAKKQERKSSETDTDYQYALLKQELVIKDLQRFNVQTLLVDHYADITTILQALESRYRRKTILISGSAHEYGHFPTAERFIQELSGTLIKNGYKIVSGFGLGVGSHVITGALQQIYEKQGKQLHDQLVLRPFPQGDEAVQRQWEAYRQDMVSYAGVAIFIFGNKLNPTGNDITLANGVKREFDIAKELGLKVIPVGSSGYMAKKLWKELMKDFDAFYPNQSLELKQAFDKLGQEVNSPDNLIAQILDTLNLIEKENIHGTKSIL
jgi:hypothetical protein